MTQTQTDSSRRYTRRGVIRRTALGVSVGTGGALAYDDGPVQEAEAIAPLVAAGLIAAGSVTVGAVAGAAFGATFLGPDSDQVSDALGWNKRVEDYTDYIEQNLALDQTIASLERDVQLVDSKAREEAIFAIYEQAVDSGTEADATTAAEDAIHETYAVVERAILDSWDIRLSRFESVAAFLFTEFGENDTRDSTSSGVFSKLGDGGYSGYTGYSDGLVSTASQTLLNGNSYSYLNATYTEELVDGGNDVGISLDPTPGRALSTTYDIWGYDINQPDVNNFSSVSEQPTFDQSSVTAIDSKRWSTLYSDLVTAHDNLIAEVSDMVSSYFQPAADGEIDLIDAVGPQYLADTASTAGDYQEAAMAFRSIGLPLSKQVVTISLPTPDGGTQEFTGRLSWTAHNGSLLPVGSEINPDNVPGSIYAAVNLPDGVSLSGTNTANTTSTTDTDPGAETFEITAPFTIVSAEGASAVGFEDRSLAESATSLTAEEVNQLFKDNYAANQEATETVHDTATGGGGGSLSGSDQDWGVIAIGAGAIALGWGYITGDGS